MGVIFISYSHVDTAIADELVKMLEKLQIQCFRDVKDISLGERITSSVADNIKDALLIVVVLSPASLKSHWVPFELGQAVALGKKIIPLLTHPSLDVPYYIQDLSSAASLDIIRKYFSEQFKEDLKSGKLKINDKKVNVVDIRLNTGQEYSDAVKGVRLKLTQGRLG